MHLTELTQQELCREARESVPFEVCGFVLNDGRITPMENVNRHKGEWSMDRRDSIAFRVRHRGAIAGTYHSHPKGSIKPSRADMEHCPPRYTMWIVTQDEVWRWFRNDESWFGINESAIRAVGLSQGTGEVRPEDQEFAYFGGEGRLINIAAAWYLDQARGSDQSLADWIRKEADT